MTMGGQDRQEANSCRSVAELRATPSLDSSGMTRKVGVSSPSSWVGLSGATVGLGRSSHSDMLSRTVRSQAPGCSVQQATSP